MESVVVRMLTSPMMFWNTISNDEWDKMSDDKQDELVEIAKNNLDTLPLFTIH